MSVLGHSSVSMSLVYAQLSDPEILDDYQAFLGPDATLAGPSASDVRNKELPSGAVDWLKMNFLRTELELGHCLRLPPKGPCEWDLFLTCAKFVTTPPTHPGCDDVEPPNCASPPRPQTPAAPAKPNDTKPPRGGSRSSSKTSTSRSTKTPRSRHESQQPARPLPGATCPH